MSPQPPRAPDAKVEGRDKGLEMGTSPYERFRALAKGLLQVPMVDVLQKEQGWQVEREAKRKHHADE